MSQNPKFANHKQGFAAGYAVWLVAVTCAIAGLLAWALNRGLPAAPHGSLQASGTSLAARPVAQHKANTVGRVSAGAVNVRVPVRATDSLVTSAPALENAQSETVAPAISRPTPAAAATSAGAGESPTPLTSTQAISAMQIISGKSGGGALATAPVTAGAGQANSNPLQIEAAGDLPQQVSTSADPALSATDLPIVPASGSTAQAPRSTSASSAADSSTSATVNEIVSECTSVTSSSDGTTPSTTLAPGGMWCGESTGSDSSSDSQDTDPVVQGPHGPQITGPTGTVVLGPPGYVPPTPNYSLPSLNDVTIWVEDQLHNGTLVPPSGEPVETFVDNEVAQLMQGNPNTDNARYYATANPNSYGYRLFWGLP